MKIALTFDIDWAAEFVLKDLADLLSKYGVKSTFFTTHRSEVIHALDRNKFEIALHPNFNELLKGGLNDYKIPIDNLLKEYPEAKGTRSHCLFQTTHIIIHATQNGLIYDSNLMMPLQKGNKPFFHRSMNVLRIPFFWADDTHLYSSNEFGIDQLPLGYNEYDVIAFHPIHVFLNTEKLERYNEARPFLQNEVELKKYINHGEGTRTLLIKLLEKIKQEQLPTFKQIEIANLYYEQDSKRNN